MNRLKNILKFEYTTYIKSKSYIVTSIIFLVIIILAGNVPNFVNLFHGFSADNSSTNEQAEMKKAAIFDHNGEYTDDILAAYYPNYQWSRYGEGDKNAILAAVEAGEYEFALEVQDNNCIVTEKGSNLMNRMSFSVNDMVKNVYQNQQLLKAGLTQEQASGIMQSQPVIQYNTVGKDITQTFWLGYALLMLLYMSIVLYGQFVMASVVTEKSSKTMELLITSAKPVHLMFGKVLGVGLAGLTQFGLIILTTYATLTITRGAWESFAPSVAAVMNLTTGSVTFLYAIIFFLLGFFVFAFLYASFASTVSRMEEANSVVILPMLLVVAAFMVSMLSMSNPEASFAKVFSFIPFFSPMVMFMRICVTDVPLLQILLAIVIDIASIIVAGIFGARLYRAGVMMYGKPPSMIAMLKYMVKS